MTAVVPSRLWPSPARRKNSHGGVGTLTRLSPDDDGGGQRNWGHHKAEVDPPFIRLDGLGYREQVDGDPQSHRETQCQPNEVAGGLVYGPKGLALGSADAHRYCHERTHEQRSENDRGYS